MRIGKRRLNGTDTAAWLRHASAAHRRNPPGFALWPNRAALVERLAPGRSFLDLGGMFSVAGDVAFQAESAGASRVVLFDGMDPSIEFDERHRELGSAVTYVQGDLHDPEDIRRLGSFDIVWCAGVIYHSPNPYQQLHHLRSITAEWLLLGTHVIPEVPGIENACIFYPGRSTASETAFAQAHGEEAAAYPGMTRPFDTSELLGYANMWWGLSSSAVRSMLTYAGFELTEEFSYSWDFSDFLARPGQEPSFIPPLGFSRARGEDRLSAHNADDRPPWATA